MRIKGSFAVGFSFALVLTLIPITAFSAQKITPGSACKVYKQEIKVKNEVYTCVKSGKKLVWRVGVKDFKKTSNSDFSQPTKDEFEPWSTNFSDKTMITAAYKNFTDWIKLQDKSSTKHNLIIQDSVSPDIISVFKALDSSSSEIFSQYFPSKSVTVLGNDEQWVKEQITASGGNLIKSQGTCNARFGNWIKGCMNRDSHQGYIVDNMWSPNTKRFDSIHSMSVVPHEYFHLVQINLSDNIKGSHWNTGEKFAENSFPNWLVEGSANFIGTAILSSALKIKYEDVRRYSLSNFPRNQPEMANQLADYEVRTINNTIQNDGLFSYNIGHIATEYLVASIGFQNFLNIWIDYKTTRNFYLSFENITGIDVPTFYAKFEMSRKSLGVPPVTWKLENGINKPIVP